MPLKNNDPVSMEKRTDLASLFCMIGRHGPAVAVAVIAMVSVMAGFIIYRTVRGKRRKAAAGAGDGDSRSPAALRDALVSESEQCVEETRGCESTGLNEDDPSVIMNAHVTRSPYNLRNRRSAAEKNATANHPKKEVEPEREEIASHVLESSRVAEKCAHSTDAMKDDVSQQNLPYGNTKYGGFGICLMPTGTSGHENEEVSRSQATIMDILSEASTQEETYSVFNSQFEAKQTIKEFLLEEPIINMDDVLASSKDSDIKEVHCPLHIESSEFDGNNLSLLDEMENVAQVDHEDDNLIPSEPENVYSALKPRKTKFSQQDHSEDVMGRTMSGTENGITDADHGPTSKVIEEDMDEGNLKNLGLVLIEPETQEYIKQDVKSEKTPDPNCNQDTGTERGMFSPEHDGSSAVLKTAALTCLNMPETTHDDDPSATKTDSLDLPSVSLQPENEVEDAVVPELAKDTCLEVDVRSSQSMNKTDGVVIHEETVEYILSSSHREPTTAVHEIARFTAPVSSTESVYPEKSLFQNQESDQIEITDALSEVAAVAVQEIADGIKPQVCQIQLLSCDQSELTLSLSGVGEESGISSMTVSPDLPDTDDGDNVVLSVTDHFPESEDHAEAKGQFFADDEATSVCNEESAETVLECCPSQMSQQAEPRQKDINGKLSTSKDDTPGHEIKESCNQALGLFTVKVPASDACLTNELQKEMDVNKEKMVEEEDKTTEFSIMEATMDNNEWITDGNYQVLPWMNVSVLSAPLDTQTDPASSEHEHTSVTIGDCRGMDTSPSTQVRHSNTDENKDTDKKVVAVQPMPQNVNVTFRIHYLTHSPYQKVAVTGNQQELGNWKEYILLEKSKDGLWSTVVSLPVESHVEWKFVVVDQGKVCRWEECGNRLLDTGYAEALLVHKWWGLM